MKEIMTDGLHYFTCVMHKQVFAVCLISIGVVWADGSPVPSVLQSDDAHSSDILKDKRLFFESHERTSSVSTVTKTHGDALPVSESMNEPAVDTPSLSKAKKRPSIPVQPFLNYAGYVQSRESVSIIINAQPCRPLMFDGNGDDNNLERELDCSAVDVAGVDLIWMVELKSVLVIKEGKSLGIVQPGQSL